MFPLLHAPSSPFPFHAGQVGGSVLRAIGPDAPGADLSHLVLVCWRGAEVGRGGVGHERERGGEGGKGGGK